MAWCPNFSDSWGRSSVFYSFFGILLHHHWNKITIFSLKHCSDLSILLIFHGWYNNNSKTKINHWLGLFFIQTCSQFKLYTFVSNYLSTIYTKLTVNNWINSKKSRAKTFQDVFWLKYVLSGVRIFYNLSSIFTDHKTWCDDITGCYVWHSNK